MKLRILIPLAGLLSLTLMGNSCDTKPPPVNQLAEKARKAAEQTAAETTDPTEIENIAERRRRFGKPGLTGYVVFLNEAGQPVWYGTVKGKCTSSNKRLTTRFVVVRSHNPHGPDHYTWERVGEDGTQGSSDNYIYCFTTAGRYLQWNGPYLYSDGPIELTIKPLVIEVAQAGQGKVTGQ